MALFLEQWEELTDNKWVLYRLKRVQDPIQVSSSPIGSSDKSESVFLPVLARRDRKASQETGSGKGTESGNSRLLFPAIPSAKKEWKVTTSNRSFVTKSVYRQTAFQDGDSQVSKTIDNDQRLGCLHRSDRCIFSCTDTSDIQKIPSVRLRTADFSVHGLSLRNVPKSVDFHEINGSTCNSSTRTTTCHISLPIPRRLADKRSDSQLTDLSNRILPSNGTKSRFYTKSKKSQI